MGKWFTFERVTTVWALALGTIALLTIFVGLGVWITDNSSNVASWVQAVGSIGAIAAGFGVARFQLKEGLRQQVEREADIRRRDMQSKYLFLAYKVSGVRSWARTVLQTKPQWDRLWDTLQTDVVGYSKQLDGITISEYPEANVVVEIVSLQARVDAVRRTLYTDIGTDDVKQMVLVLLEVQVAQLFHLANGQADAFFESAASYATLEEKREAFQRGLKQLQRLRGENSSNPFDAGRPQTPQPPAASQ